MTARIVKAPDLVHEHDGRFYVAAWVERAAQYQWPLPERTRRLSGCSGGFSRSVAGSPWVYRTRAAAVRAARRVFAVSLQMAAIEAHTRAWLSSPEGREEMRLADAAFDREIAASLAREAT